MFKSPDYRSMKLIQMNSKWRGQLWKAITEPN